MCMYVAGAAFLCMSPVLRLHNFHSSLSHLSLRLLFACCNSNAAIQMLRLKFDFPSVCLNLQGHFRGLSSVVCYDLQSAHEFPFPLGVKDS